MENDIEDYYDFEKDNLNFEDIDLSDVKIKPNIYIHLALIMAQRSLVFSMARKDGAGISDGVIAYRVLIEQMEVLAQAANFIKEDYDNNITKFLESEEYKKITNETAKSATLANKKLYYIMKEVFKTAPVTFALRHNLKDKEVIENVNDLNASKL